MKRVYIGFDSREIDGYAVTRQSIEDQRRMRSPARFNVHPIILDDLRRQGLYNRRTTRDVQGRLYDVVSQHHMSTEFAISRFFVPELMRRDGAPRGEPNLAIFMDSDMLVTCDLDEIFACADPAYAVQVVKHNYKPENTEKMDGQVQSQYNCKNWSSVILWNVDHPAHKALTLDLLHQAPGRDLHQFCWLTMDEIGELPPRFNHLVGHDKTERPFSDFKGIVHFTEGLPSMGDQYNVGEAAAEWWRTLHRWAHN